MIECNVCLEDKPESEFHNLTIGVSGHEPYWSCLIDDACKSCLDPNDIKVLFKPKLITYEILNQSKYIKTRQINWTEKVLGVSFNDLLSSPEAIEIINESGVNQIHCKNKADSVKSLRKNLKVKEKLGLIPEPLKIPATLTGTSSRFDSRCNFFHLKGTIERYIHLSKRGKYHKSNTHQVLPQRLIELAEEDYVVFDQDNDATYFLTNTEEGNTVCRKCGEIKNFDQFRSHKYNPKRKRIGSNWGKDDSFSDTSVCGSTGIRMAFMCYKCESIKGADRYKNFSPEEKQKHRDDVKQWKRNNRDKLKEYKKTPEARVARNLRRRLKGFLKSKDHNFNKDIGCTRKELVQHLESLFNPGMNWENYGSGENGDHKDSWHIDHIIPISKFTGKSPNHFTNLQPMWGLENIQKSNKISHQTVLNLIS